MYLAPTIEEIDAELQALYDSIDDFTEDEGDDEDGED